MPITAPENTQENQAQDQASAVNVPANQEGQLGLTYPQKTKFRFNKDDTGFQRPSVEVEIPVPNYQGLTQIILNAEKDDAGKKAFALLQQMAAKAVIDEVRGYVSDNANASQETIPWDKFTFQAIANMPAGIRGASAIPKEVWDKWLKDYVSVMPAKTGTTAEVCATRGSVMMQKFRPLTGNPDRKKIIENLMATLAVYVDTSPNVEEFTPILEFLAKKADELKAEDSIVTADALGF
jgi:hypothetical protein